jgi:hypothetical protein
MEGWLEYIQVIGKSLKYQIAFVSCDVESIAHIVDICESILRLEQTKTQDVGNGTWFKPDLQQVPR